MTDKIQIQKKSKCERKIKSNMSLISEIKNGLLNIFMDVKNNSNIKIIKCINELFSKNGLRNNIGN